MSAKTEQQELDNLIYNLRIISLILNFAFSQEKLAAVPDVEGSIREATESHSLEFALSLLRDKMRYVLYRAVECEKYERFILAENRDGTLTEAFRATQPTDDKQLRAALQWIQERALGKR